MLILGIDSSAEEIAVAIVENSTEIAAVRAESQRSSEMLVELIVECYKSAFPAENSLRIGGLSKLERIAIARGPGSYTGLRTGLGTAFGLSQSLAIPITGISVLAARICASNPRPGNCEATLKAAPGEEFFQNFLVEQERDLFKFKALSALALRPVSSTTGYTYPVDLPFLSGTNPATAVALAAHLALSDLLHAEADVLHAAPGESSGISAIYGKRVNAKTLLERNK